MKIAHSEGAKRKRWGIYDLEGTLLEGGFFSKTSAEDMAAGDYGVGTVKVQTMFDPKRPFDNLAGGPS